MRDKDEKYSSWTSLDLSQWLIVVPARLDSSRLPRKALADLGGKPMVVRVCENVQPLVQQGARLIVATDNQSIVDVCEAYRIESCLTRGDHLSGTARCGEVAEKMSFAYILNLQGDEPFVRCDELRQLMVSHQRQGRGAMSTMVHRIEDPQELYNPNLVKAVMSQQGTALYFSRAPIPYLRSRERSADAYGHIGVYAFDREVLATLLSLEPSPLELAEGLEQLRALEHGIPIRLIHAAGASLGVDTAEDLELARLQLQKKLPW
ncbi:MAG: 3-deoxy-manno-octulosonate cytidylyltransferase [Zetaproteobacteria bacterium]|nr:3-deoxy-manno-octulosonate cytidylyltransferase [Zetaproteobacteria bacterium]